LSTQSSGREASFFGVNYFHAKKKFENLDFYKKVEKRFSKRKGDFQWPF